VDTCHTQGGGGGAGGAAAQGAAGSSLHRGAPRENTDTAPAPSLALSPTGARELPFAIAFADRAQPGFDATAVLRRPPDPKDANAVKADRETGWSPGSAAPASLTLLPAQPVDVPAGRGIVPWEKFFTMLSALHVDVPMSVHCEWPLFDAAEATLPIQQRRALAVQRLRRDGDFLASVIEPKPAR
jgi:hypothetical protein